MRPEGTATENKRKKKEREDRRAPEQQPICFFTISTRKTLRLQLQTPANERQAHCTSITSCCHRCNTQKVSLPLSAIIKVYARYMNTSKAYFQLLGAHISMFGRKYLSETFRFDTQVDMNSTNWNWQGYSWAGSYRIPVAKVFVTVVLRGYTLILDQP